MTNPIDYKKIAEPVKENSDWSEFYAEALRGNITAVQESNPQPGYYRWRFKGEHWRGLAIFQGKSGLQFLSVEGNGKQPENIIDPIERGRMWTWCPKNPIKKAAFKQFMDTGCWPDLDDRPKLSNLPADPFEALRLELADKCESGKRLLDQCPASQVDKETADKATNIANEISAMLTRADALHKEKKDYWLQGGREVDAKFKFRETIKGGILFGLKELARLWKVAEQRRANAEADAARAKQAAEADRQRQAESAKLDGYAAQYPGLQIEAIEPAPVPQVVPRRVQTGGGFGAKSGLRKEYRPRLVNLELALKHYGDCEEVLVALNTIAKRLAGRDKEKTFVWGFEIVNELDEVISDGVTEPKVAA